MKWKLDDVNPLTVQEVTDDCNKYQSYPLTKKYFKSTDIKTIPSTELNTERTSHLATPFGPRIMSQRVYTNTISQNYTHNFKPVLGDNLHFKWQSKMFPKKLRMKEHPKTAYLNTRSSIAQSMSIFSFVWPLAFIIFYLLI